MFSLSLKKKKSLIVASSQQRKMFFRGLKDVDKYFQEDGRKLESKGERYWRKHT